MTLDPEIGDQGIKPVISRADFAKKVIRAALLLLIATVVLILGGKVVTGKDCYECPGKGICNGESDCDLYFK